MQPILIAPTRTAFTEETFNTPPYSSKAKDNHVIEIYTENLNNTCFAIALNRQRFTASSFGADQKTALKNIFRNLPFNVAFQVFY